jgi:hypothetical protein
MRVAKRREDLEVARKAVCQTAYRALKTPTGPGGPLVFVQGNQAPPWAPPFKRR